MWSDRKHFASIIKLYGRDRSWIWEGFSQCSCSILSFRLSLCTACLIGSLFMLLSLSQWQTAFSYYLMLVNLAVGLGQEDGCTFVHSVVLGQPQSWVGFVSLVLGFVTFSVITWYFLLALILKWSETRRPSYLPPKIERNLFSSRPLLRFQVI